MSEIDGMRWRAQTKMSKIQRETCKFCFVKVNFNKNMFFFQLCKEEEAYCLKPDQICSQETRVCVSQEEICLLQSSELDDDGKYQCLEKKTECLDFVTVCSDWKHVCPSETIVTCLVTKTLQILNLF